jgi:WD40 repeat protein
MSAEAAEDEASPIPQGAERNTLRGPKAALADLAFGSFSRGKLGRGTHLALLTSDTLELDLSDPIQRRLGNYELLELIGEGGMGVVYRARQVNLNREVAIKLLAAGPWASREFIDRFVREAQHAASMQHPHIVTIYEVGTAEELHYFSMRLVRGVSLATAIHKTGPYAPRRAAQLMCTVAEAVNYAHSLGVLHLDLKPANVLLDENEAAHVADFGLARQLDRVQAIDNTELSGTPSYMAPEQAEVGNIPLTTATDIWGLGGILYELVTGYPPFRGPSAQETLNLLRSEPVRRPRRLRPDLPPDLEAIILKCLEREPARRYPSARDLGDDLMRFHEHRAVRARPLNAVQRLGRWALREPRLAATAMLAVALLVIGLITTSQQWRRAEANAVVSNERLWESRRDTATHLQTDGMGFEALPGLLANIEEQERVPGAGPAMTERLQMGFILQQGVRLIDRMVIADARPLACELSPDGSLLAIALDDLSVRWFDTSNLAEKGRVDLAGLPTSDGALRAPRLLRFVDNQRLRVTLDWRDYLLSPSEGDTYLVDLENRRVIEPPAEFRGLTESMFSADGRFAMLRNSASQVQLWQVEPWMPRSALIEETGDQRVFSWLPGRGGKRAWTFPGGSPTLSMRDMGPDGRQLPVTLPYGAQLTAGAEDHDGSKLALGDSTGRVYLLDIASNALRQLATPFGTRIRWLSFSEDDAWLAAVREDGSAFAFDVAGGNSLNSGLMQHAFEPQHVVISHKQRLMVVSGEGVSALWRLPEPGPSGLAATRQVAHPTRFLRAGTNSVGVSMQSGLLASVALDGEVRLWRMPAAPLRPETAAMQIAGSLHFDGEHLVDIAWNRLRLVSLKDVDPSPWVELAQPIGFAELLDGGKLLVATSGPAMHFFDTRSMREIRAPIVLPANPLRFAASADGHQLVVSVAGNGAAGFEEHLHSIDAQTGKISAEIPAVHGPLRQIELSADGSRLLVTGPADGSTDVFDSISLHRIGHYPHVAAQPVLWARFEDRNAAARVWLLERDADDTLVDGADLVSWEPAGSRPTSRRHVAGVFPVGMTVAAGRPILSTREQELLDPSGPTRDAPLQDGRGEATGVFAVSHDGRLIAHVIGRDVQIHDARTLAPIGSPLHSNLGSYDFPAQLEFSPDDSLLLGRALNTGRWLIWPVAAEQRSVEELKLDVALLDPIRKGMRVMQLPDASQHQRLRRNDPGRWPAPEARPTFNSAGLRGGTPLPARQPDTSPLLLDLTEAYSIAPFSVRDINGTVFSMASQLPFGVARLDGMDYDIRGAFELRYGKPTTTRSPLLPPTRAAGIRTPAIPIAAFRVLLLAALDEPESAIREYASLRLHYVDGSTTLLPIETNREVPGTSDSERPFPFAWERSDHLRLQGFSRQLMISNPRLPNPHPDRLIAHVDFETPLDHWAEPVVFAITAEPVIAVAQSRNDSDEKPEH